MFYSKKIRTARDLKQHLVNRKAPEPCTKGFWNRKFSIDLDKDFWSVAFRAIKETRLRVLHWKILHNIYPTNILLCKMKVKENNKCTYCNEFVDYIEHFFFECPVVRDFWQYIEQHILINFNVQVHLIAFDILFGIKCFNVGKIKLKKMNHVILIAKMCISIFRKTQSHCALTISFFKPAKSLLHLIHKKVCMQLCSDTNTHTHSHTYTNVYQALRLYFDCALVHCFVVM